MHVCFEPKHAKCHFEVLLTYSKHENLLSIQLHACCERSRSITLLIIGAGNDDLVHCFFCGLGLKLWKNGDVPLAEHVRFAPDCPFIQALVHGHEQEQREINEGRNCEFLEDECKTFCKDDNLGLFLIFYILSFV